MLLKSLLALHGGTWTKNPGSPVLDPSPPQFSFKVPKCKVDDSSMTHIKVSPPLKDICTVYTGCHPCQGYTWGVSCQHLQAVGYARHSSCGILGVSFSSTSAYGRDQAPPCNQQSTSLPCCPLQAFHIG
ncbi:hypothetical protein ID866_10098 [Astraeus odoratus]|nr:hypothetical protein ID866_10098 [Astraeus odoratus]